MTRLPLVRELNWNSTMAPNCGSAKIGCACHTLPPSVVTRKNESRGRGCCTSPLPQPFSKSMNWMRSRPAKRMRSYGSRHVLPASSLASSTEESVVEGEGMLPATKIRFPTASTDASSRNTGQGSSIVQLKPANRMSSATVIHDHGLAGILQRRVLRGLFRGLVNLRRGDARAEEARSQCDGEPHASRIVSRPKCTEKYKSGIPL